MLPYCRVEGRMRMWATPLMRKKHIEKNYKTGIAHLVVCRLREGYTIRDVSITKGKREKNK